jgi:hypothetical protein
MLYSPVTSVMMIQLKKDEMVGTCSMQGRDHAGGHEVDGRSGSNIKPSI